MKPVYKLLRSILGLMALAGVFVIVTIVLMSSPDPDRWAVTWVFSCMVLLFGMAFFWWRIRIYIYAWQTDLPVLYTESIPASVLTQEEAITLASEHLNDAYCPLKLQRYRYAELKRNWSGSRYVWRLTMTDQAHLYPQMRGLFLENTVEINGRTGEIESCSWDEYYASRVKVSPDTAIAIAMEYLAAKGWSSAESDVTHAELHLGRYPTVEYERYCIGMPLSQIWWSVYRNIGTPDSLVRVDVFARDSGVAFHIQTISEVASSL